jgi:hypothetical protein
MFMVIKERVHRDRARSGSRVMRARYAPLPECPPKKNLFLRNEPNSTFGINGFTNLSFAKRTRFLRCAPQIFNFRRIGSATASTRSAAMRTLGAVRTQRASLIHPTVNQG